jgi:alpha-tubulin suppressor-like RCC1 family protein
MKLPLAFALGLVASVSCKVKDPLYCDENTPCTDEARPFCDLNGEYEASEGIKRTCIPDPFAGADGGASNDGGQGRTVTSLATASTESCAVLSDGGLRCWGNRLYGELIGDDESPRDAGDVETGAPVAQVAIGQVGTCIRYVAGNVRCWGDNSYGLLGYGHKQTVEGPPIDLPDVDLGGSAVQLSAGENFFCALLDSGDVRCWGFNSVGQLGLGNTLTVGDNEVPADKNPVNVGGLVLQIASGRSHTCVVLEGGLVRCWGQNGITGKLGYGHEENIGDTETPASAGYVDVGGEVISVAPGAEHTCALMQGGAVRCWGGHGLLGIPDNDNDVGDDEDPSSIGTTDVGGAVRQLVAGASFTCAVREDGNVVCWGGGAELGYGTDESVGDDETPAQQGPVPLGGITSSLSAGGALRQHSCAWLDSGDVRCWGRNYEGQLGLRHLEDIGDDETPDSQDPVEILD